ncbi:helix-turn-helix domain-containing protein [Paenibacillus macerans]|uniref:helix-turn-helix domain-containing protein n=1 Tax=Paenibacillus macerans TaxID=44252 RepID=UPI003D312A58
MNNPGYRRLRSPRLSVYLLISSALALAVLLGFSLSASEAERDNKLFAAKSLDATQATLKNMERLLADQMMDNEAIYDFFENNPFRADFINYRASGEIFRIVKSNSLIHSLYLYRAEDRKVITAGYAVPIEVFPDRLFALEAARQGPSANWSAVRSFSKVPLVEPQEQVISIAKSAMPYYRNEGLIVLNVKVDPLLESIGKRKTQDNALWQITDREGQPLLPKEAGPWPNNVISSVHSAYTGWSLNSGVNGVPLAGKRSVLILPSALAALVLILSSANLGLAVRHRRAEKERQRADNERLLRKHFFLELLNDEQSAPLKDVPSPSAWPGMKESGIPRLLAVAQIDQYSQFLQHDKEEIHYLKGRLQEAAQNAGDRAAHEIWAEWISGDRLAVMVNALRERATDVGEIYALLDDVRARAPQELGFTITISVGGPAPDPADVKRSFTEALAALQYKMSLGGNRVLIYGQIQENEIVVDPQYFRHIEDFIHQFRVVNPAWEYSLAKLFGLLEGFVVKREQVLQLLNYMIYRFAREMEELPAEVGACWNRAVFPGLSVALQEAETMAELRGCFNNRFAELFAEYAVLLETKDQRSLVYDIRRFIEENFTNPEMSLELIGERFGIHGKYASQLFKEEFGVKFVDFLIALRIERAKRMLKETTKPIHEISLHVGYNHAISFGRIFKKILGMSPGDYRKQMQ